MTMHEFRNQMARLRYIDRDDLPEGKLWDEDWPSFLDNPFYYFLVCSDERQEDIWRAMEHDRTYLDREAERAKRAMAAFAQLFGVR